MAQTLDGSAAQEYQSGLEKTALDKLMGDFTKREDWRRPYELLVVADISSLHVRAGRVQDA
jgi:hypothetical protein